MIIQLLSALQAIHSYGLACRSLDCKHVLETARNRVRVGSVGVMDVLEPRSNVGELQSQDLRQLGCVLVLLGSRGCAATELASLAVRYSERLVTVVRLLLQGQFGAAALLEQCAPELMKTMNSALSTSDYYYDALVRVMNRVRYRDWNMRMEGSCGCW